MMHVGDTGLRHATSKGTVSRPGDYHQAIHQVRTYVRNNKQHLYKHNKITIMHHTLLIFACVCVVVFFTGTCNTTHAHILSE